MPKPVILTGYVRASCGTNHNKLLNFIGYKILSNQFEVNFLKHILINDKCHSTYLNF
jgi:hypothetical protein